jgi:hypothetical protein
MSLPEGTGDREADIAVMGALSSYVLLVLLLQIFPTVPLVTRG